jgi:signal transduction histidine kinase
VRSTSGLGQALQRVERAPPWTLAAVFVVAGGAVTGWMVAGHDSGSLPLLLLLGAYVVAAYRPLREVLVAAASMAALLLLLLGANVEGFAVGAMVATAGAFAGAFLIGWTTQSRRWRIDALEHGQAEAALRAAADERLRIAQELHDVVAHSLGVIAVQSGVGLHVIDTDPAEARRSFANISQTSRSSLAEIRRLLSVVRAADGTLGYTPVPGLADLDRLIAEVTAAGLPVELTVVGEIARVPGGVGLAAYRIIQEALTNTLRHAHARRSTVRLDCASEILVLEVSDDGRGPTGRRPPGHGLIGMRERVTVYGGSLDTGAGPAGGYRVAARLPFDPEPEL